MLRYSLQCVDFVRHVKFYLYFYRNLFNFVTDGLEFCAFWYEQRKHRVGVLQGEKNVFITTSDIDDVEFVCIVFEQYDLNYKNVSE